MSLDDNETGLIADVVRGYYLPIGTIIPYAAPIDGKNRAILEKRGWLPCDGTEISRKDYAQLFAVIGDIHGRGNAVDTFNLPDYQGRFLRGVDHGRGLDPDAHGRQPMGVGGLAGDNVGSVQDDQLRQHVHGTIQMVGDNNIDGVDSVTTHSGEHHNEHLTTDPFGGNETRPVNAYVNWVILARSIDSLKDE